MLWPSTVCMKEYKIPKKKEIWEREIKKHYSWILRTYITCKLSPLQQSKIYHSNNMSIHLWIYSVLEYMLYHSPLTHGYILNKQPCPFCNICNKPSQFSTSLISIPEFAHQRSIGTIYDFGWLDIHHNFPNSLVDNEAFPINLIEVH